MISNTNILDVVKFRLTAYVDIRHISVDSVSSSNESRGFYRVLPNAYVDFTSFLINSLRTFFSKLLNIRCPWFQKHNELWKRTNKNQTKPVKKYSKEGNRTEHHKSERTIYSMRFCSQVLLALYVSDEQDVDEQWVWKYITRIACSLK